MDSSNILTTLDVLFNLHSIINNGLIPGGQNSSKRQTVFFLPIDPLDKEHQDPEHIDFSVPRRARYVHSAWKKHQDAVFWVDINLTFRKGLTFYQTRSNAIILQGTLPAYCIPKVVRLKIGEVLYWKSYMSEQGDLLLTQLQNKTTEVYHEANTLNVDDEVLRKRMEKSIVVHDENHESMMVNEADVDFNIPGLPHSVVKHAQSTSVRQLIQKIENHPNRHALQQDLQQSQSFQSRVKTNDSGCWEHRIM